MIFDQFENAKQYRGIHAGLDAAFEYIARHRFEDDTPGKVTVDGERIFYTIAPVQGKGKGGAKLEAHKRYIDIQFVLSGEDLIGLKAMSECQWDKNGFDAGKDIGFCDDQPESWIVLKPGMFVILWPQDAHAPLSNDEAMNKVVFKIALDW
jgi:YhcH/YjgK/YiaL family protein